VNIFGGPLLLTKYVPKCTIVLDNMGKHTENFENKYILYVVRTRHTADDKKTKERVYPN
jgi:hypothetical protein